MADWIKKCVDCKEEVIYGQFGPCRAHPGTHRLENKVYYHPGARSLSDVRDRRLFAPVIHLVPAFDYVDPTTQKLTKTAGLIAHFQDGKFSTDSAEHQYYLDHKPGVLSGAEGEQMWNDIYLTPEQNLKLAECKLADVRRQTIEANDLLAQVKAQAAKGGKEARA